MWNLLALFLFLIFSPAPLWIRLRAKAEVPSHGVILLCSLGRISFPLVASEWESPVNTPPSQGARLKERRETEDRGGRWQMTVEGNAKTHLQFPPWEATVTSFIEGTKERHAIFMWEQFSWEQHLRRQDRNSRGCGINKIALSESLGWTMRSCSFPAWSLLSAAQVVPLSWFRSKATSDGEPGELSPTLTDKLIPNILFYFRTNPYPFRKK